MKSPNWQRRGTLATNGRKRTGALCPTRSRPDGLLYVDDVHLSPGSMAATRKLIAFIERDLGQNDEAAITSASGQIGFLQQLSDNRSVLHAAINRLSTRSTSVRDMERPPMSEYQALQIDRFDKELLDYFVDETIRRIPGLIGAWPPASWPAGPALSCSRPVTNDEQSDGS